MPKKKVNLKELGKVKSPMEGGNIFSLKDWGQRILWVMWFGACFAIGAKALNNVDKAIPGNITPNNFKDATAVSEAAGFTVI